MPCYRPIPAYWAAERNDESRKRGIAFAANKGFADLGTFHVPCGKCMGCRLSRSRNWSIRCMHEAKQFEKNCFITLTYKDSCLPEFGSLYKPDFQRFMYNLRAHAGPGVRVYWCGEYGTVCSSCSFSKYRCKCPKFLPTIGRPHYHALLFNFDFDDKKVWKMSGQFPIYRSSLLEKLWDKGHSSVGELTYDSAAYVARYTTKKISGEKAPERYGPQYCPYPPESPIVEGQVLKGRFLKIPEFGHPSSRPGLGKSHFLRYWREIYENDSVIFKGRECKPPRYYDKMLEKHFPEEWKLVKRRRRVKLQSLPEIESTSRLLIREKKQFLEFEKLMRRYEDDHEDF